MKYLAASLAFSLLASSAFAQTGLSFIKSFACVNSSNEKVVRLLGSGENRSLRMNVKLPGQKAKLSGDFKVSSATLDFMNDGHGYGMTVGILADSVDTHSSFSLASTTAFPESNLKFHYEYFSTFKGNSKDIMEGKEDVEASEPMELKNLKCKTTLTADTETVRGELKSLGL